MNYIDTKTAAYLLGMPVRTLNHHVKADGAPKAGYDKYDPAALIQWYAAYMRQRLAEAQSGSGAREAQRRNAVAKARIAEMKADAMAGTLVSVPKVQEEYGRVVYAVRARLLALPARVTPHVVAASGPVEVNKILDDAIWDALDELAHSNLSDDPKPTKVQRKSKRAR